VLNILKDRVANGIDDLGEFFLWIHLVQGI